MRWCREPPTVSPGNYAWPRAAEEIFNKAFFGTVQLVFAGSDSQGLRYGTTGTLEQFFVEWKDEAPASATPDAG